MLVESFKSSQVFKLRYLVGVSGLKCRKNTESKNPKICKD